MHLLSVCLAHILLARLFAYHCGYISICQDKVTEGDCCLVGWEICFQRQHSVVQFDMGLAGCRRGIQVVLHSSCYGQLCGAGQSEVLLGGWDASDSLRLLLPIWASTGLLAQLLAHLSV